MCVAVLAIRLCCYSVAVVAVVVSAAAVVVVVVVVGGCWLLVVCCLLLVVGCLLFVCFNSGDQKGWIAIVVRVCVSQPLCRRGDHSKDNS